MMMVGYENVTQQKQCGIVEALLSDMNIMMYDEDESDNEMPGLEPCSDSGSDDGGDEEASGRALGDPLPNPTPINHTHKEPYSLATTAVPLNLRHLSSAKVAS